MIQGDEQSQISEESLEEINEFLDKAYEYYINNVNKVELEDEPFDCESILLNHTQFDEIKLENHMMQ